MALQSINRRLAAGIVLFFVTILIGLLSASQLPSRVVVHWNATGQPDGTMAQSVFLIGSAVAVLSLVVFFEAIPRIDPLSENIDDFRDAYDAGAVLVVAFVVYVYGFTVAWNLGYHVPIQQVLAPAIAVLYVAMGFVVERAERNWFVGIRTPWTLSSETVWQHTHRLAAKLFKIAGVVALGGLLFPTYFVYFIAGPAAAIALFSTIYSYIEYQRVERGDSTGQAD